MNAEIIQALEEKFPAPIALEETISDIEETIKILKRFKGRPSILHLADQLGFLVSDLSLLQEEGGKEAKERVDQLKAVGIIHPDSAG